MTAARERTRPIIEIDTDIYAPQHDSFLLCDEIESHPATRGARVLDVCTGSGIAAIQAARSGAASVFAFDISARAVACTADNAHANGVVVDARVGTITDASTCGPFDLVVANPPYVPSPTPPSGMGLHRAWDAGDQGRSVLDALCTSAFDLLTPGGTVLFVQSQVSGIDETLTQLRAGGLDAHVTRTADIPFGPVMLARADWLEATGKIETGCRTERLVVIEATRRYF